MDFQIAFRMKWVLKPYLFLVLLLKEAATKTISGLPVVPSGKNPLKTTENFIRKINSIEEVLVAMCALPELKSRHYNCTIPPIAQKINGELLRSIHRKQNIKKSRNVRKKYSMYLTLNNDEIACVFSLYNDARDTSNARFLCLFS